MLVQPFAKQQVLVYQSLCCVSMSVMNQQVQQQAQQVVANMAFDAWLGRTYEWSLAAQYWPTSAACSADAAGASA